MLDYIHIARLIEEHQILLEKMSDEIEEFKRAFVARNGARLLLDYDLRVNKSTILDDDNVSQTQEIRQDLSEYATKTELQKLEGNIFPPPNLSTYAQKTELATTTNALNTTTSTLNTHTGNTTVHITANERTTWNNKANPASITAATKARITYNSQGIITAGADLASSDIPNLDAAKITTGTLGADRVPNLNTSKLTDGLLPQARGGTGNSSLANAVYNAAQTSCTDASFFVVEVPGSSKHGYMGTANVKQVLGVNDSMNMTANGNNGKRVDIFDLNDTSRSGFFAVTGTLNGTKPSGFGSGGYGFVWNWRLAESTGRPVVLQELSEWNNEGTIRKWRRLYSSNKDAWISWKEC